MKALVPLLLLGLQGCAAEIACGGQDKRLRIIKNNDAYQLQLYNSTNRCATLLYLNFTLCNDERGLLEEILGRSSNYCSSPSVCEAHNIIESFFSDCACTNDTPARKAALAFGSLTGLLVVILVLVVTGWMWTCWTLKKNKEETQHCKKCQNLESDSEEERVCPNKMYKMTSTQPVVGNVIEQSLDFLEESGESINGLGSKDNKSYRDVKRVENVYTSSEGSSHSSLQDELRVKRVDDGDNGEKHAYHVLEKPGGDDCEDVDINLEENTAMEYETPVPLNEL